MAFWQIEFLGVVLFFAFIINLIKHFYYKKKHKSLLHELENIDHHISKNAEINVFYMTLFSRKSYIYIADVVFIKNNIFILKRNYIIRPFCLSILQFSNAIPNFYSENVSKAYFYYNSVFYNKYFIKLITGNNFEVSLQLKDGQLHNNYDLTSKS